MFDARSRRLESSAQWRGFGRPSTQFSWIAFSMRRSVEINIQKFVRNHVQFLANVNVRYMSSSVRLSSVCRSVVCNVRAPYSGDWNFRQCFYAILYLGHLWAFGKNFTEIVAWEHLRLGGGVNRRGVAKYNIAILDLSKAISRKRCKIGDNLLLITNRKSHMSFRMVSKSVTLNDLERRNSPN